jgi:hypothetical protein
VGERERKVADSRYRSNESLGPTKGKMFFLNLSDYKLPKDCLRELKYNYQYLGQTIHQVERFVSALY